MSPTKVRILRALFWAYVVATFVHIAYVVYREPFAFDAWNIAHDTDAKPFSVGNFFEFWRYMYTESNPRIGQPMAYLAYKLVGVAEIGTPLAYFAIVLATFVLGTKRWPDRANNRDLAVIAIGVGLLWFAAPNLPAYMFCRAYATNYIWLIAIQLWFLVPLRLYRPEDPVRGGRLAGFALLGVVAGMGNEHVGPTLIAGVWAFGFFMYRRDTKLHPKLIVAAIAPLAGYAIIFFAPGQSQRYDGLAEKFTLTEQILTRGLRGNMDIYVEYLQSAAPQLVVLACAIAIGLWTRAADSEEARARQRGVLAFFFIVMVVGSLITITVFASPKLGPRFYLHAMVLLLAPVLGAVDAFVQRPRSLVPFVVLAAIASGYAFARTVPLYTSMAKDSERRLAELAATPRGGIYTAPAWDQVAESWWALGDDMRDQKKQEMVAKYFGLSRALFRGPGNWSLLGLSDVKLTMHYDLDKQICLDEVDTLQIKQFVGRDVGAIQHAFLDAIVEIEQGAQTQVQKIDLVASFLGTTPPLPRSKMYLAKWEDGVLEGYTARMKRVGRAREREIVVDPKLKTQPWEIFITAIGDPPKRLGLSTDTTRLTYEPWRRGTYWVTACRDDYCFVLLALIHTI
ncbi:MAG: DUF6056 family protein [Kofleriaceae bacterium]